MKRSQRLFILVCLLIFLYKGSSAASTAVAEFHSSLVYGYSELGRDLICHRIGRPESTQSLLMVFGIHGFEDAFDHDGEVLKQIAESLISHYTANTGELGNLCLYIVPCANPDGLIDGTTHQGFGRCNANEIDVNRDFPFNWIESAIPRNQTGETPFATAESRAIRDLVEMIQPTYGMDIHGWKEASYGNGDMAEVFAKPFRFEIKRLSTEGMLCAWLNSITEEAILLELPPFPDFDDYVTQNSARLIEGVNAWAALRASR